MKRVLISAGLVWVGAAMLLAQSALPASAGAAAGTQPRCPQSRARQRQPPPRGPGSRSGARGLTR